MKLFNALKNGGVNDILIAATMAGEWGRKFPTVVSAWRRP
jgi:hypothetical protein